MAAVTLWISTRGEWQPSLTTSSITGRAEPAGSPTAEGSAVIRVEREVLSHNANTVDHIERMTLVISPEELEALGLKWSK